MSGVYGLFHSPLKSGCPFASRGTGPAGTSGALPRPPRPPPRAGACCLPCAAGAAPPPPWPRCAIAGIHMAVTNTPSATITNFNRIPLHLPSSCVILVHDGHVDHEELSVPCLYEDFRIDNYEYRLRQSAS